MSIKHTVQALIGCIAQNSGSNNIIILRTATIPMMNIEIAKNNNSILPFKEAFLLAPRAQASK